METQRNLHEIIASDLDLLFKKYDTETVKEMFASRFRNDLQTKVEYIDKLYEVVLEKHGTVEKYIEEEFSLTNEDIQKIRGYYLED